MKIIVVNILKIYVAIGLKIIVHHSIKNICCRSYKKYLLTLIFLFYALFSPFFCPRVWPPLLSRRSWRCPWVCRSSGCSFRRRRAAAAAPWRTARGGCWCRVCCRRWSRTPGTSARTRTPPPHLLQTYNHEKSVLKIAAVFFIQHLHYQQYKSAKQEINGLCTTIKVSENYINYLTKILKTFSYLI